MGTWIVLPTKGCKCATCERLREVVNEDGTEHVREHCRANPSCEREVCICPCERCR